MTEAGLAFLIPFACVAVVGVCMMVAVFAEKVLDVVDHFRRGY